VVMSPQKSSSLDIVRPEQEEKNASSFEVLIL